MQYKVKNVLAYDDLFFKKIFLSLNTYQKHKIRKLKKKEDQYLSMLGLYMIATLLNTDVKKIYYKMRKPYVKDKNVYFSIAHKYPLVAVVVHSLPVGIDIEMLRSVDKNTLSYLKASNSLEALILWTRKEALYKRSGNKKIIYRTMLLNHHAILSLCY